MIEYKYLITFHGLREGICCPLDKIFWVNRKLNFVTAFDRLELTSSGQLTVLRCAKALHHNNVY